MARDTRDILFRFLGDSKDLEKASKRADGSLSTTQKTFRGIQKAALGFAAALGAQEVLSWAGDAIQLASAAEEVDSKFQAVFGTNEELKSSLREWGDVAGVTETQAENLAATFGNLATAQGISQEAAGALALDVATLAGDMASFNDADPAQVFEDINKGMLTTEREGLKKYGIAVSETEVKQRALTIATQDGRDEVTQADRAMASFAIITQQAGKAVGDLERTQDSAASKQRQLKASTEELQEEVGKALLPVYDDLLTLTKEFVPLASSMAQEFGHMVAPITAVTGAMNSFNESTIASERSVFLFNKSIGDWIGFVNDAGEILNPFNSALNGFNILTNESEKAIKKAGLEIDRFASGDLVSLSQGYGNAATAARDLNTANDELEASRVEEFTRRTRAALNDVIGAYRDAEEAARRFGSLDFTAFNVGDDRPSEEQAFENRQGTPSTRQ